MNPNLLRAEMARYGYTQGKTADLIGMHRNTFSRKIKGEAEFSLSEIRELCKVLRITDPVQVFDLGIEKEG